MARSFLSLPYLILFFGISCAYAMPSQSAKCPNKKDVNEALMVLQKEDSEKHARDIFDLHPEWDQSSACVEKVFRDFIALPEKSQEVDASQEVAIKPDLLETRKGFSQALKVLSYLKKPEEPAIQEKKKIGGVPFVKVHSDMKPDVVILYLHGGGYVLGYEDSSGLYNDMFSTLVKDLNSEIYVPVYRIRPESPLSASLEDSYKAYKALTDLGIKPKKIVLMGDSAGGGLALRLLLKLKQEHEEMPRMAILLSPWTDLTNSGRSVTENAGRDMFSNTDGLDLFTKDVLGQSDPKDPMISPLYGDYTGFPKLLYVVSGSEIFRDDTLRDIEKAKRQGVQVDLIRHDDGVHVYPGSARFLKSGREALSQIVQKVKGNEEASKNICPCCE